MRLNEDALEYHRTDPAGTLEISTTKPANTQRDLSLAYSPGMTAPCRAVADGPAVAYTTRSVRNPP
jgi:malate dehydrogenase (oxaloacetate-decarboxylating)(NADP+)